MSAILVTWVGMTDLRASEGVADAGLGPIAQGVDGFAFDELHLLSDFEPARSEAFRAWLGGRTAGAITVHPVTLSSPTAFGEIHESVVGVLDRILDRPGPPPELTFHLSPGTPAMAAVWIILAKTRFPARLIESSAKHGARVASVPFDISAEFIPSLLAGPDARLRALAAAPAPEAPEFADIVHDCEAMRRVVALARRAAARTLPVLIEGESGTGKELFARAVHRASPRADKAFVAVNCGAIAKSLMESELFGHEKGAFTGAAGAHPGVFERADGGTLFLDEVGELDLDIQVKLLRVLQEGELVRLGGTKTLKVDVRIVAATNRNLLEEVREGRFREDLFYRLAVAVLRLPPLRERPGDLGLLIDRLLDQVNRDAEGDPGFHHKNLSPSARNLLLQHPWPGNVRELLNTLQRAAIWADGETIETADVRGALLPARSPADQVLDRPLGEGFDLSGLLADVARHYLGRAMADAHGNKTKAADLVGLSSYQTLTNWLRRYGLEA
ncbi:MAG: sigma 54-interacting transcriptional regulator [Alphaproteobacteria bacterium]|nr:sigma 54-interacting transcriptional regulator [Alphaproteobacteria bacterium]